jgi:hypothetical protein
MFINKIPQVFSNYTPLISKIDEYIDFGCKNVETLKFQQKNELVSLIMDALEHDQIYAIFDTDEFIDNCNHFKKYLLTRSMKHLYEFTVSLEKSAFKKYEYIFTAIFDHLNNLRRAA